MGRASSAGVPPAGAWPCPRASACLPVGGGRWTLPALNRLSAGSCFPQLPLGGVDPAGAAAALRRYMSVMSLSVGQLLWKVGRRARHARGVGACSAAARTGTPARVRSAHLFVQPRRCSWTTRPTISSSSRRAPYGWGGMPEESKGGRQAGRRCQRRRGLLRVRYSVTGPFARDHPSTWPRPAPLLPSCAQVDEFTHEAASSAEQQDDKPAVDVAGAQQADTRQARRLLALKSASAASLPDRIGAGHRVLARSYDCGPGCVAGSTDFYLARPHGTRAVCRSAVARVLRVPRSGEPGPACPRPRLGGRGLLDGIPVQCYAVLCCAVLCAASAGLAGPAH